jgi:predicted transcriptional regulator
MVTLLNFEDLKILKKIRLQANLTQRELAKRSKTTQSTIAKIEAGKLEPSLKLAKRILNVLSIEPAGKITAKDVMVTKVQYFLPFQPVKEAIEILLEKGFSQAPVIENDRIIGKITESLIISKSTGKDPMLLTVNEIMDEVLPSVPPETTIEQVIFLLKYNPAILVISKGNLLGIITKADIMEYILKDIK